MNQLHIFLLPFRQHPHLVYVRTIWVGTTICGLGTSINPGRSNEPTIPPNSPSWLHLWACMLATKGEKKTKKELFPPSTNALKSKIVVIVFFIEIEKVALSSSSFSSCSSSLSQSSSGRRTRAVANLGFSVNNPKNFISLSASQTVLNQEGEKRGFFSLSLFFSLFRPFFLFKSIFYSKNFAC